MLTRGVFLFLLGLSMVGCATGTGTIDNLNISLTDLQRIATAALPLGKRAESQNGREFISEYFVVQKGEYVEAAGSSHRHYAKISVLGDRRPYKIDVQVIVERKDSGGEFDQSGYDEGLARVITRRIQKTLHERRDDRNIIDDFRVF